MKLLINTKDKTITVEESFLIYDLLVELNNMNIDLSVYKITIEPQTIIKTEYIYIKPYDWNPWWNHPIYGYGYNNSGTAKMSNLDKVILCNTPKTTTSDIPLNGTSESAELNNITTSTTAKYPYTLTNTGVQVRMQDIFGSLMKDID